MSIPRKGWRRLRKVIASAVVCAVALASAAACSSGGAEPTTSGAGPGTLRIPVSSADASDLAFRQLNADFEKAYPGVTVAFSSVPNSAFNASRSAGLTAGNLDVTLAQPLQDPSYVKNGSEGEDALAADAGLFLDLPDQPFLKNFTPRA